MKKEITKKEITNAFIAALAAGTVMATTVQAQTLQENQSIEFEGIFCKDLHSAKTLLGYMNELIEENDKVRVQCQMSISDVVVMRKIETRGEWNIVEVQTEDNLRHFLVTTFDYDDGNVGLEEGQFEGGN